ncbi:hypothetical protein L6452_05413 [Arctium lappa]|uniref:Uncharacterized protein n=1 Tax=Arctium lappa TaxID=4217 RepID=A0ACB9EGM9_ARCLA|nr:hypothetical protein L6452_05413 [Arctium lappa]
MLRYGDCQTSDLGVSLLMGLPFWILRRLFFDVLNLVYAVYIGLCFWFCGKLNVDQEYTQKMIVFGYKPPSSTVMDPESTNLGDIKVSGPHRKLLLRHAVDRKIAYEHELFRYLDDYTQVLVVAADHVNGSQLNSIRDGLLGRAVILMGDNPTMCHDAL